MTASHIDSPANPRVRAWAALRDRKQRDTTGTFLVEGQRETERLAAHCEAHEVILIEGRTTTIDAPTVTVSERVFAKLSRRQNPDGVAAVLQTPDLALTEQFGSDAQIVLIADGIEKPGNIGAILRSADAFGASFIGSSLGTDMVNPNVLRASQGSVFAIDTATATREDTVAWAERRGLPVVVASPEGTLRLWDMDLRDPCAVVIGAEAEGVDPAWRQSAELMRIPTAGSADSLNASVTAAVILAEAARQRSA